jgi:hypothetical protein
VSLKVKKIFPEEAFRETEESKSGWVIIVEKALSEGQPK